MDSVPPEIMFFVLFLLIASSGFFSSSETALMAINRYRLKHLTKEKHAGAKRVSQLLERPDRLIGLILIGNNLVNFAASAIATLLAYRYFGDSGVVIATIGLTITVLVFAEVGPKTVAAYHPERVAFPASFVLLPLLRISRSLVWLINQMALLVVRPLGINPAAHEEHRLSPEELRTMVLEAQSHHADNKAHMMVNILDLNDASVDDILVRRHDIIGIDISDPIDKIQQTLLTADYTRLPVYDGDINNILGVFHLRNAAKIMIDGGVDLNAIKLLMKDAYFIPENTPLTTQLNQFQLTKERLAIVVDEYGDIVGLVTLEDILEEIVGEFTSDVADSDDEIVAHDDGSYAISGAASLRDINKVTGWQLNSDDAITLNGLLLEHLESFPEAQTGIRINDYQFEILEINDNRIDQVRAIAR